MKGYMIVVIGIIVFIVLLYLKFATRSDSSVPATTYYPQQQQPRVEPTRPAEPPRVNEKKQSERSQAVPTTPTEKTEIMNPGESKSITVGTNLTVILVPKGYSVSGFPGVLKGYQGENSEGLSKITLQTRGPSVTYSVMVVKL